MHPQSCLQHILHSDMMAVKGGELDRVVWTYLGEPKEEHNADNESTGDDNVPAPCSKQPPQLKRLLHN